MGQQEKVAPIVVEKGTSSSKGMKTVKTIW